MGNLSTYWKDLPDKSTPLAASVLNAWGGEVEQVRDQAEAARDLAQDAQTAAEQAAAGVGEIGDADVAGYLGDPGSASSAAAGSLADQRVSAAMISEVDRADAAYTRGELGYAQITSQWDGTATATKLDVPGLSVTVTVGQRPIYLEVQAEVLKTAATDGFFILYLMEGSTQLQQVVTRRADSHPSTLKGGVRLTPTPGVHTYRVQAYAGAGLPRLTAAAIQPAFLTVLER